MKRLTETILILAAALNTADLSAQRRVSADVEVKNVVKGSVSTVTKSVYCSNNGRLVTFFHTPEEYYLITNPKGEAQLYMPSTNEVLSETSEDLSSRDELLSIYMSGRTEDLGLSLYGYKFEKSTREDGLVKKVFVSTTGRGAQKVEIVYENFLPIYCAYLDGGGKVLSRTYFSDFAASGRLNLPHRVTTITYSSAKDSTVVRTLYSNVRTDTDDPMFDFVVPADAKIAKLPNINKK